jgi:DNA-binding MarR family transcriptional regulator
MNDFVCRSFASGNVGHVNNPQGSDASQKAGGPFDIKDQAADAPLAHEGFTEVKRKLVSLAKQLSEHVERLPVDDQPLSITPGMLRASLRQEIKSRRTREQLLPADLFADPAWDMLLELTLARLESRQMPVSSLCIAGAVPTTTGLRWVKTLLDRGLVERVADPEDGRRHHVVLVDETFETMMAFLRKRVRMEKLGAIAKG